MYNSNYEEYMRNMLGYSITPQNTYQMPENIYEVPRNASYDNMDLESLYPDIYKMIQPMVQKACVRFTGVINEEAINSITEEIYDVMVEDTRGSKEINKNSIDTRNNSSQNTRRVEETRQNNYLLRDLIRILIIKELLRRRPNRPPMRPGYPVGPNFPMM